ncbi:MAG: ABC transporter substrate-binding protein [bacterium]
MRKLVVLAVAVCLVVVASVGAQVKKYNEPPMLLERVRQGKLPPVEQRLPKEPFVIGQGVLVDKGDLNFEIGQYGGILRMAQPDPAWNPDIFLASREALLETPGVNGTNVIPSIVRDYKVSADEKVFTFYMREGLKWSDGTPVTSEDVLFTYEDVLLNKDLTPVFPQWMKAANKPDGEPMKLEVLDKYTFRVSFTQPYGGLPAWLSIIGWKGYTDWLKPKHYLKQFHVKYTPLEKLEPEIQKAGLAKGEWWSLFNQKDVTVWELTRPEAIGFPVLYPWIMVEAGPQIIIYERNPYYFKVDPAGNQLPYIDGIRSEVVQDVEMVNMKVLAGEIDYLREDASIHNLTLYKENEKKGGYRTVLYPTPGNPVNVRFNLTYPDPVWRQVVRDVRFRRALTHAINRKEIIDAIFFGFAEPEDMMPNEYDPARANQLLDEMGMSKHDADGYRLGPDGKTFVIPFEVAKLGPWIVPVTEMVVEHFKAVGVKTTMKVIDAGLWSTRAGANEIQATMVWDHRRVWWGWGGPFGNGDIHRFVWPLWWSWHTSGGKMGEEPPAEVKKFFGLLDQSVTASPEKAPSIVDEYRRLYGENIWFIELVKNDLHTTIVSQKLGNVPPERRGTNNGNNIAGEQFFFRK